MLSKADFHFTDRATEANILSSNLEPNESKILAFLHFMWQLWPPYTQIHVAVLILMKFVSVGSLSEINVMFNQNI